MVKTSNFVLDGGSLLHRLKWTKGQTYEAIAKEYAEFAKRKFGNLLVRFDGYDETPSIKDDTHRRRKKNTAFPMIKF